MIRLFFSHTAWTRALTLAAVAGTLLLSLGISARAEGEATPEQQERVETVVNRLVTAIKTHPAEYTWPPIVKVTKDAGTDNADAGLYGTEKDTGLSITMVRVSPSLLTDIVKDDDDTMAFILGHELSHCLHKDSQMRPELTQTNYLFRTFTRQQEYDADKSGMKMALAAGYSFKRALGGPREFIAQGHDYSSFEATSVDHPSWRDRIAALDKDQESLWRSMSAFENGQYFLTVEQYESAGRCFTGVTESFPDCSEAWSNLGYAKLMQYCDGLKTADIRRMGLGQIVVGGFYQRPRSLELKVRGTNPHPWNEAVVALQQALKLNPQLTLAKANLALAYLVAPEGRDPARAAKLFQEAATMAAADMAIDPFTRAAVLVNAGVADIARGQMVAGRLNIDRGERAAAALAGPGPAAASTLSDAVLYNRALGQPGFRLVAAGLRAVHGPLQSTRDGSAGRVRPAKCGGVADAAPQQPGNHSRQAADHRGSAAQSGRHAGRVRPDPAGAGYQSGPDELPGTGRERHRHECGAGPAPLRPKRSGPGRARSRPRCGDDLASNRHDQRPARECRQRELRVHADRGPGSQLPFLPQPRPGRAGTRRRGEGDDDCPGPEPVVGIS